MSPVTQAAVLLAFPVAASVAGAADVRVGPCVSDLFLDETAVASSATIAAV